MKEDVYTVVEEPEALLCRYSIRKNGRYLPSVEGGNFFFWKRNAIRQAQRLADGQVASDGKTNRVVVRCQTALHPVVA